MFLLVLYVCRLGLSGSSRLVLSLNNLTSTQFRYLPCRQERFYAKEFQLGLLKKYLEIEALNRSENEWDIYQAWLVLLITVSHDYAETVSCHLTYPSNNRLTHHGTYCSSVFGAFTGGFYQKVRNERQAFTVVVYVGVSNSAH